MLVFEGTYWMGALHNLLWPGNVLQHKLKFLSSLKIKIWGNCHKTSCLVYRQTSNLLKWDKCLHIHINLRLDGLKGQLAGDSLFSEFNSGW